MAGSSWQSSLKDGSIESQLDLLQLAEHYLESQSKLCAKYNTISSRAAPPFTPLVDKRIRNFLYVTQEQSKNAEFYLASIKEMAQKIEHQAKEQKAMEELLKESSALNEMVIKVASSPQKDIGELSGKRRAEEYDELEERVMGLLKTCKKLKRSERVDEAKAVEFES